MILKFMNVMKINMVKIYNKQLQKRKKERKIIKSLKKILISKIIKINRLELFWGRFWALLEQNFFFFFFSDPHLSQSFFFFFMDPHLSQVFSWISFGPDENSNVADEEASRRDNKHLSVYCLGWRRLSLEPLKNVLRRPKRS